MAKRVTASLTINFNEDSVSDSAQIKIEIDGREDGLNEGITTFRPGDSPGYLIFLPAGMTIVEHDVSAGVISSQGTGSFAVNDFATFANSREASLSYPANNGFSASWHGKSGGSIQLLDDFRVGIPEPAKGRVLRYQYNSTYRGFRIKNIPSSIERLVVYVEGETS